jgi:hypothetical protein
MSPAGTYGTSLVVPPASVYGGSNLYFQGVWIDAATPFGLSASRGLHVQIDGRRAGRVRLRAPRGARRGFFRFRAGAGVMSAYPPIGSPRFTALFAKVHCALRQTGEGEVARRVRVPVTGSSRGSDAGPLASLVAAIRGA